MKRSIKETLKSFFIPFRFQMYCSCINYIHVLSFSQLTLENVYKISEDVSFCYCTEITIALKKMYPQKIVNEVNKELGGGEETTRKGKRCKFPGVYPGEAWQQIKLNHALYSLAVAYQDQVAFVLQDQVAHNPEYFASHYVCILPPFPEIKM